jgi:hypothetical protein
MACARFVVFETGGRTKNTMLKQRKTYEMLSVLLACGMVVLLAGPAGAKRDYLERYQAYFGLKETGKCVFCHDVKSDKDKAGKGNLGLYGKEVQKLMGQNEEYKINVQFAAVALFEKDADGDGVTNMEEMALNTYPGNAQSVPQKAQLDEYRKRVAQQKAAKAAQEGKTAATGTKKPPAKK